MGRSDHLLGTDAATVDAATSSQRVRLVLDSGGVSSLAGHRARLAELRRRDLWPPMIPTVVLTESLSGDHRRDFHANRLVRMCELVDVDEQLARLGAELRASTGSVGAISATDAIVAAVALRAVEATILTSDPHDLAALVGDNDHVAVVKT